MSINAFGSNSVQAEPSAVYRADGEEALVGRQNLIDNGATLTLPPVAEGAEFSIAELNAASDAIETVTYYAPNRAADQWLTKSDPDTLDPWHLPGTAGEPSFENAWANHGQGWQEARFRKVGNEVFVEGLVRNGQVGTNRNIARIFLLPAGYRPEKILMFSSVAGIGVARIDVDPDGTISVYSFSAGGSALYVSITLSFSV